MAGENLYFRYMEVAFEQWIEKSILSRLQRSPGVMRETILMVYIFYIRPAYCMSAEVISEIRWYRGLFALSQFKY